MTWTDTSLENERIERTGIKKQCRLKKGIFIIRLLGMYLCIFQVAQASTHDVYSELRLSQ